MALHFWPDCCKSFNIAWPLGGSGLRTQVGGCDGVTFDSYPLLLFLLSTVWLVTTITLSQISYSLSCLEIFILKPFQEMLRACGIAKLTYSVESLFGTSMKLRQFSSLCFFHIPYTLNPSGSKLCFVFFMNSTYVFMPDFSTQGFL